MAVAGDDVVEIDESIRYTEEENKAIQDFISEIKRHSTIGDGDEVDEETAIKFLMARKFDMRRAISLFNSHKVVCEKMDLVKFHPFQEPLWSELISGKFTVLPGKNLTGARVCLFTERLHFPRKSTHNAVLKSLVFQLNELTKSHDAQLNGIVLIYDMKGATYKNFEYDLCMKTLSLLQGAFPAKLKNVYILSAPFWFRATLKILSSFLREKIRNRVEVLKTAQDIHARIPLDTLPEHLGGRHEVDHDTWLQQCISGYHGQKEKKEETTKPLTNDFKIPQSASFADKIKDIDDRQEDPYSDEDKMTVDELITFVNEVGRNGIYDEYYDIASEPPSGTFEYSRHPMCERKNRYSNVLCYDHSRVKLGKINQEQFSNYINASYVDGFRQKNAYICTQGPMINTTFDFWRMVLENKVEIIVMITKCIERGREKCFKYWPNQLEHVDYDTIRITNKDTTQYNDYVIRTFVLEDKQKNVSQQVRQVQFKSWPDFGVLSSADKFLDVLRQVRSFQSLITSRNKNSLSMTDTGKAGNEESPICTPAPIVVHCSAGIGRTGTYLAIDISLHELESTGGINIRNVVRRIRKQRAFCVQTEEQYAFCYSAVLEHIIQQNRENGECVKRIEQCLEEWTGDYSR